MAQDRVLVFDTTLRDGEQSPGASMTLEEKVRIARALERLRVDIIEAGFAIASPGDFAAVQAVAETVKEAKVCSLARVRIEDLDAAAGALKSAVSPRIHTFIATSPIHMHYKLRMLPEQVIEQAVKAVHYARNLVEDVEFSCEDAGRSDPDFLCRIIEAAITAGARTINIPDTVGYSIPGPFGQLIALLLERIPNAHQAVFSVHCHNDLGLAVANSLSAIQQGARQVECTINGLGERAGNAALEELVMAIRTRQDLFQVETRIETTEIVPTSRLVSSITGFPVQPNKAIVGVNAFAHESGIHQDGVMKHRETYEIMRAQDVGWNANKMVLGKHSGRAAFRARLEQLGASVGSDAQLNALFERFKELADKKHEIYDEDLQALVSAESVSAVPQVFELEFLEVLSKTGQPPEACLKLKVHGQSKQVQAIGSGPVDASFRAIEALANSGAILELYSVNAITSGTDSQGEVQVRLNEAGRIVNGQGADTDILVASVKAYLDALNLLHDVSERAHPQLHREGV